MTYYPDMGKKSANQPGIQKIAAESGVSTATVSRVLNRHPYVSDTVRMKVLAAARKNGYAPTIFSTHSLFGILGMSGNDCYSFSSYFNQVLRSTSQVLFQAGCNVQIFSRNLFPYILPNTFRGVMVFSGSAASFFQRIKIPCVTVNDPVDGAFNVVTDHGESCRIAVEYLLELGHRRIGFLHSADRLWGTLERLRGWHESLASAGIPVSEHVHADFRNPERDIPSAAAALLRKNITALIVEGEDNGLIADHELKRQGIRIPEELSLVSFEQSGCSKFMSPAHTTVCQDFDALGRCAAETLIDIVQHPALREKIPSMQILHNHLIKRESCAPPKTGGADIRI